MYDCFGNGDGASVLGTFCNKEGIFVETISQTVSSYRRGHVKVKRKVNPFDENNLQCHSLNNILKKRIINSGYQNISDVTYKKGSFLYSAIKNFVHYILSFIFFSQKDWAGTIVLCPIYETLQTFQRYVGSVAHIVSKTFLALFHFIYVLFIKNVLAKFCHVLFMNRCL